MKYQFVAFLIFLSITGCKKKTIIPIAPSSLNAIAVSTSEINLSWTDNSTNETSFKIERKSGNGNYTVIETIGADITSFNDTGLTPNTSYTYRVYAYNSAGNSLSYTNEATATTFDPVLLGLANGLVAYYPFSGNAGDSSGNNHHGTVNGTISYVADRKSKSSSAMLLGNGFVTVNPTFFQYTYSQTYSISMWFTLETTVSSGRLLSTECPEGNFRIAATGGGQFGIQFGSNYQYYTPTQSTWVHLAYVYENRNAKLYINGSLLSTTNNVSNESLSYCNPFTIGAKAGPAFDKWQGKIDEVRVYNRTLSVSEIQYLLNL